MRCQKSAKSLINGSAIGTSCRSNWYLSVDMVCCEQVVAKAWTRAATGRLASVMGVRSRSEGVVRKGRWYRSTS